MPWVILLFLWMQLVERLRGPVPVSDVALLEELRDMTLGSSSSPYKVGVRRKAR